MDKIHHYILNNKIINDYFSKIPIEYRNEFKQHIWLNILEIYNNNENKINELYESNNLGKYIIGIINNQLKSKNSSFFNLHKKNLHSEYKSEYDDNITEEEYYETDNKRVISNIIILLDKIHFVDAILFKLYRGICTKSNTIVKPLTYSEIKIMTGIPYKTVWYSINKVNKIIKNNTKI